MGNIEAKTDAKGRVFIPSPEATTIPLPKARAAQRRIQDCAIYSVRKRFKTQNQLKERLNKWNAKHQDIFRQFVSDAEIMIPDGNRHPSAQNVTCKWPGIQSDVRFIGVDNTMKSGQKRNRTAIRKKSGRVQRSLQDILGDEDDWEEEEDE